MKTYIIPIFIPHYGCPHTCVFCSQRKITGVQTDVTGEYIENTIRRHLAGITKEYYIEVAFYGGSFTALDLSVQYELLAPAYAFIVRGEVNALRLSTRPDCIDDAILMQLKKLGVKTIELGAQSFDDEVLKLAERGHIGETIGLAAKKIRAYGFSLGLQLMPGLPGDTWRTLMYSLAKTIEIRPQLVRIYPTLVLDGTALGRLYEQGDYSPLTLSTAISYAAIMKLLLERNNIQVIRTGLQSSETLDDGKTILAGPYHPAFGEMVDSYLYYLMVASVLEQMKDYKGKKIILHHHPKDTSRLRGNKNSNKNLWMEKFLLKDIQFIADESNPGHLTIYDGSLSYQTNLAMLELF
jgi:histone acetyltransferase (RNA polymerase elongator complex component)